MNWPVKTLQIIHNKKKLTRLPTRASKDMPDFGVVWFSQVKCSSQRSRVDSKELKVHNRSHNICL